MNEVLVEDFLNNEVKKYSLSVIKERAIPSLIDGMKPSQRKIIYTAEKVAKNFTKTSALIGQVMSEGGYEKGDGSLGPAIVNLVQDFTGANNITFLEGQGSFGSRFLPSGSASPRYTKTRLHKNFNKYFVDKEILNYEEQDGEYFEPTYFLPIIPILLTNPTSGIAVGFACEFHPYKVEDIIENILRVLDGKKQKEMIPHYNGYTGNIYKNEEGKFIMEGVTTIRNNVVTITEIPIGISRETYISILDKLEEQEYIDNYQDNCSKGGFKFIVELTKEGMNLWKDKDNFYSKFKLTKNLNENLNAITENESLKEFNNANEIIEYFVKFRLKKLSDRKSFKIKKHKDIVDFHNDKLRFLKQVIGGEIKLKFNSKADFIVEMETLKYNKDHIERLINIPVYKFTQEEIDKTKEVIKENVLIVKYYEKITEKELYEEDMITLL